MSIATFYAPARWRNRFGVTGPNYGPQGHRGHDIGAGAGEAIPALRGGVVRKIQTSSVLGPVVVIEVGPGDYDGYAHTKSPAVSLGQSVSAGQTIAYVAGYNDNHGSAWTGPHLHLTNGPSVESIFSGTVRDPAPIITNAIAGGPALSITADEVKLIARFLNTLGYGRTTTADKDGKPLDAGKTSSNFYWLAQTWGSKNGYYPQPAYKIDGAPGTRTLSIVNGPLLAAAKAWATPPVEPPPAWVPPTKAEYDKLIAELAEGKAALDNAKDDIDNLEAKIATAVAALA